MTIRRKMLPRNTVKHSSAPQHTCDHCHYAWISASTFFITASVLPGSSALVINHCM
jgi:hypothetical protein